MKHRNFFPKYRYCKLSATHIVCHFSCINVRGANWLSPFGLVWFGLVWFDPLLLWPGKSADELVFESDLIEAASLLNLTGQTQELEPPLVTGQFLINANSR
jgi:hypothetical protein